MSALANLPNLPNLPNPPTPPAPVPHPPDPVSAWSWREMAGALAELVLPRRCAGCGRPGAVLCATCLSDGPGVAVPAAEPDGGPVVYAAGLYTAGLRAALLGYKERGRTELAGPLGGLLAGAVRGAGRGAGLGAASAAAAPWAGAGVCLVPIPSSARAIRGRGGDHVLRLARIAARRHGLPVVRALRVARQVADSAGLGRDERAANLAGAFAAAGPPRGRVALLVDDIVTTGATLREARRALWSAGWPVAAAAVVAATPRRSGRATPATSSTGQSRGLPWA